jgi:hypothetical protein
LEQTLVFTTPLKNIFLQAMEHAQKRPPASCDADGRKIHNITEHSGGNLN